MKTDFAIKINSEKEYNTSIQELLSMGYTEDELWNNRKIRKDNYDGLFLVSEDNDYELPLFIKVDTLKKYNNIEEFKEDWNNKL